MSLCSNALRTNLCRSRVARPQTLLPFLYQTPTIQQRKPLTQPTARRYAFRGPASEDDIPFADADGNLPPSIDEAQSAWKTTMTGPERATFEKMFKTFNTQGHGRGTGDSRENEELDQIADEYYEDDEDNSGVSLDKVLDAVSQGRPRAQQTQSEASKLGQVFGQIGSATTSASSPGVASTQGKRKRDAKTEKERIKKLQLDERERIDTLLKTALTDQELWKILEREVLDQIRKLDLDGTQAKSKAASKTNLDKGKLKRSASKTVKQGILFSNYPYHLVIALLVLRHHFPTSPYALAILPTVKSLGRSSYALGATTVLYKYLLRTAWIQQYSYELIDSLLSDMETNVIEFDSGILEVLDAILKEREMALAGTLGIGLKMLHDMEYWAEGSLNIKMWRDVVAERLGVKKTRPSPRAIVSTSRFPLNNGAGEISEETSHTISTTDAITIVDDPGASPKPNKLDTTSPNPLEH